MTCQPAAKWHAEKTAAAVEAHTLTVRMFALEDDDGEEEVAQDEQRGCDAVHDVSLEAAEDHAGAGDGSDDGADALL